MSDPVYDVDLEIPAGLGVSRLDRVLEMLVPERTKSQLQKLVRKGSVKIDKERVVRSNVRVRAGQRLRIQFEDAEVLRIADVVCEDATSRLEGGHIACEATIRSISASLEVISIEDVVAENQAGRLAGKELLGQKEGLGDSLRLLLYDIGELDAEIGSISEEILDDR